MSKSPKNSHYFQDWLKKADRDISTAVLNHKHGGYTDVTCYFCHQVVEKVLKAYLLSRGAKRLVRIHVLPSLLSLCEDEDDSFSKLRPEIRILDCYYIEAKYPTLAPADYPRNEAEKALGMAEKVLAFVKKKIKK